MKEKKALSLRQLHDTLLFHRTLGIREYPLTGDVQHFLRLQSLERKNRGEMPGQSPDASAADRSLREEIMACTGCRLASDTPGRVPGKGSDAAEFRLMVVGDWSLQPEDFSPETIFAAEEDRMLWKMMEAIELRPEQVYVTNCLKCCPRDAKNIDQTCETSCFSFLTREINRVNPPVICAMGDMAVRVLMERQGSMVRLRGRFGSYRAESGRSVPVMPTFHPRFLLKHQEMKKATWHDLLEIQRKLQELKR